MNAMSFLQDLAVNYRKEGLYQDYLTQILPLAEQLSKRMMPMKWSRKDRSLQSNGKIPKNSWLFYGK